jgi:hypothetical protein
LIRGRARPVAHLVNALSKEFAAKPDLTHKDVVDVGLTLRDAALDADADNSFTAGWRRASSGSRQWPCVGGVLADAVPFKFHPWIARDSDIATNMWSLLQRIKTNIDVVVDVD